MSTIGSLRANVTGPVMEWRATPKCNPEVCKDEDTRAKHEGGSHGYFSTKAEAVAWATGYYNKSHSYQLSYRIVDYGEWKEHG